MDSNSEKEQKIILKCASNGTPGFEQFLGKTSTHHPGAVL
jgi:hypothetical protein